MAWNRVFQINRRRMAVCLLLTIPDLAFGQSPRGRVDDLRKSPLQMAAQPERVAPFRSRADRPVPNPPEPGIAPKNLSGFGADQVRLPLLLNSQSSGTTPTPSAEVVSRFNDYVERTIDPENNLDLVEQRPRLLVFKRAPIRVQIADEGIASYTLISETELSVVGNSVGTTILNLWFPGRRENEPTILSYLVRVIPDPDRRERLDRVYKGLEAEINRTFPNSVVKLALIGDKLAVSGQAKDIVEAAQILRVVSANAPGGTGQQASDDSSQLPVGNFNVTSVPDALGNMPQQGPENYLLTDIGRNVINLLRVPGEQQVMLRVTVAEINRAAARSIGLDLAVLNGAGNLVFANVTGGLLPTTVSGGGGSTSTLTGGNLPAIIDNGKVNLAIQALRNLNFARSLAEPNLVTMNGQPAFFRAGGEFPVPAATATFGAVGQGVQFVPFGVQLNFTPYITDRDRIRLSVMATVSTRDPSLGTSIASNAGSGSTSVSGLQSRVFRNTVELREGQTLAVAGLIQNNYGASSVRVPMFGDLPLLGPLAGRNQASSAEQEIVILVTPELVRPMEACDGPSLPGSDVFEPSDIEFYLMNRLESRRAEDYRASVRTDAARMKRYQHCEDLFIIGAKGQTYNCCLPSGCPTGFVPAELPVDYSRPVQAATDPNSPTEKE